MKHLLFTLTFFFTLSAFSQDNKRPFTKTLIVKTNLLNLLAHRPTITIEKPFSNTFSAEVSFVQGEANKLFAEDYHYDYNGFLIRAKKYLDELEFGEFSSYVALYIGNLKRNIESSGQSLLGVEIIPSRNFSANSIRTGGSLGLTFIGKKKLVIDGLFSLGYGRYVKYYKCENDSKGYLDCQVWLSIGYCF